MVDKCVPVTNKLDSIRGGKRTKSVFDRELERGLKQAFSTSQMADSATYIDRDGNAFGAIPVILCTDFGRSPDGFESQVPEQEDFVLVLKCDIDRLGLKIQKRGQFLMESGQVYVIDGTQKEDRSCLSFIVTEICE